MDNDEEFENNDLEQPVEVETDVEEEDFDVEVPEEESTEESQEDIDWQERALKAEKVIEERKRKEKEAKKVNPPVTPNPQPQNANPIGDINATISRLEVRGIMEDQDQQWIIKFAKDEGISPIEALKDEFVVDKLAYFKKQREQKASTQTPGNRTGTATKSVDYYINKGIMPTDADMADKVQTELSRRAKSGA